MVKISKSEEKKLKERAEKLYKEVKQLRQEVAELETLRKEAMERHKKFQTKWEEFERVFNNLLDVIKKG